jgi:hypothetical protein
MTKRDAFKISTQSEVGVKSSATPSGGIEYGIVKAVYTAQDPKGCEMVCFDILLPSGEYLTTIPHTHII